MPTEPVAQSLEHPFTTEQKDPQKMNTPTIDLETRFAITDLLHMYGTAIDTRDWALFRSIFADDAHIDYGAAVGVFDDADAFTAVMQQGHEPLGHTLHRVGNIVIVPGSPIRVRSYGDNINLIADNTNGHHGAAYYDDEIVATTDGYKISRRTLTMVLFEPISINLAAPASS